MLVSFFTADGFEFVVDGISFKVEPVTRFGKCRMCHPMNRARSILNCGSTESISQTLTDNLKYLPLLLIFDLEYNYLIWCSAALRARMASGRSLCFRILSRNIYRVAGDESMYCRAGIIKVLSKGNSTRKVSKVLFHFKNKVVPPPLNSTN